MFSLLQIPKDHFSAACPPLLLRDGSQSCYRENTLLQTTFILLSSK